MITTTKLHTIAVKASDLKKNLCRSFIELLQDELEGCDNDLEYFRMDLNRFQDEVDSIERNGFKQTFRDGFTMMLLDSSDFEFVDKWFNKPKDTAENLQIVITENNGDVEFISHEDLSY